MSRTSRHIQELLQLRVVLEQGSINRAAAQIGITQSGLTRSIGRLEAALGVQLLNRTARGVFSTPYSEALLDHIKLISSELDRADVELDMLKRGAGGQLTCGGTIGAVNRLFAPSINQLKKKRPELKIRVVESFPSTLLAMLRNGELDVAVCAKADDLAEADLVGESIGADHVGLFVAHNSEFLKTMPTTLEKLNESAQWILPNWSGGFYRLIQRQFESRKITAPLTAIETSSVPLLKGLLRTNGRSVAITTSGVMGDDVERGLFCELKGDWTLFPSHTMIYLRAGVRPTPSARLFIQCLRLAAKKTIGVARI